MLALNLNIPDEIHQKLKKRAEDQGRELASVAIEILESELCDAPAAEQKPRLSREEWLRQFDEWAKSHPKIDVVLDDSRETIYEGR